MPIKQQAIYYLGLLYSLSGRTSYRKMSWRREISYYTFPIAQKLDRRRDDCNISKWYDNFNTQSRGFETSGDLTVRRLTAWWIEALDARWPRSLVPYWCHKATMRQPGENTFPWRSHCPTPRAAFERCTWSQKRKVCHDDNLLVTDSTWGCHIH